MSASSELPLVSVVTPCLDPGWRLKRCIDSVKAQTYPRIEHIVVDGGSTDGTIDLLRGTDDLVWVSESDSGQTEAINKGFAMASGDILTWLNADDEFLPGAIERTVTVFADPAIGWSYGNCELVYPDKTQLWVSPEKLDADSFDWIMPIPQQGWFVRRWALDRVEYLDESFSLAMDFELCLRLLAQGIPYGRTPATLARFEIHPDSKTGSNSYVAFLNENARAMQKWGRITAYFMLQGQSCAHRVAVDDVVQTGALLQDLSRCLETHGDAARRMKAAIKAGAYTAAAQIESKSAINDKPLRALRWLFRPAPWTFGVTRRRLPDLFRTSVARWLEARGAR